MGVTDGERRRIKPRLVLWHWDNSIGGHAPKFPPRPGILLEWQAKVTPGRPTHWLGLVLYASGGEDRQWSIQWDWAHDSEIEPIGPEKLISQAREGDAGAREAKPPKYRR